MSEDVTLLETVILTDPQQHHARNLWLFSFYLAGMRVSDVFRLKWCDIQNGRLYYSMGKNNKTGSLKLPQTVLDIIAQYECNRTEANDYIFPELGKQTETRLKDKFNLQKTIGFATSRIDKILNEQVKPAADIDAGKKLTMHIARHTFGHLAGDIRIKQL